MNKLFSGPYINGDKGSVLDILYMMTPWSPETSFVLATKIIALAQMDTHAL